MDVWLIGLLKRIVTISGVLLINFIYTDCYERMWAIKFETYFMLIIESDINWSMFDELCYDFVVY